MSIADEARAATVARADEWLASHKVTESWRIINSLRDELVRQASRKPEAAPSDPDRCGVNGCQIVAGHPVGQPSHSWSAASQPVQVTDDMVEKAAFVLWEDYESEYEGASAAQFREVARAALSAALGGGDQ